MFPLAPFIVLNMVTQNAAAAAARRRNGVTSRTPVVIPEPEGRTGRRDRAWKLGEVPVGPYGKSEDLGMR